MCAEEGACSSGSRTQTHLFSRGPMLCVLCGQFLIDAATSWLAGLPYFGNLDPRVHFSWLSSCESLDFFALVFQTGYNTWNKNRLIILIYVILITTVSVDSCDANLQDILTTMCTLNALFSPTNKQFELGEPVETPCSWPVLPSPGPANSFNHLLIPKVGQSWSPENPFRQTVMVVTSVIHGPSGPNQWMTRLQAQRRSLRVDMHVDKKHIK